MKKKPLECDWASHWLAVDWHHKNTSMCNSQEKYNISARLCMASNKVLGLPVLATSAKRETLVELAPQLRLPAFSSSFLVWTEHPEHRSHCEHVSVQTPYSPLDITAHAHAKKNTYSQTSFVGWM